MRVNTGYLGTWTSLRERRSVVTLIVFDTMKDSMPKYIIYSYSFAQVGFINFIPSMNITSLRILESLSFLDINEN